MRILIANRGEIARRIQRTAHRLGHQTIAVFAHPDADAPHVHEASASVSLGDQNDSASSDLASTYLSIDAILHAASVSGADAVHPGYGFLAENAEFARRCARAGLLWIGPKPEAIDAMGSKIEARRLAAEAGVPVLPGFSDSQDPSDLLAAAADIGWPVLVKASAGGGGKGIRIAHSPEEFPAALAEASSEAERTFGDGRVIVERYIERPRHIEVQVVGDHHGTVIDLGTRECSVQRRYQKLWEEAPAPGLSSDTETTLRDSARALAEAIGYDSAGTVEFIVDDADGQPYFLEMNTRLQVEHPVTEAVTGVDLVELMIRTAEGAVLPSRGAGLVFEGHAIEARILAEDPSADFAPGIGPVHQIVVPDGVRWDAAIEPGSEITPHYDSMVAKLIVHGSSRPDAMIKLGRALDQLIIDGPTTTAGLHRWLVDQPAMLEGRVTTRFLDETELPPAPEPALEPAARAWAAAVIHASGEPRTSPWFGSTFTVTPHRRQLHVGLRAADGEVHEIAVHPDSNPMDAQPNGDRQAAVAAEAERVAVNVQGWTQSFEVPSRIERWAASGQSRSTSQDAVASPFPAVVAEVLVAPGDQVEAGQVLVRIEAMKMLHPVKAAGVGTVDAVPVEVGQQVASGQVLVAFAPNPTEAPTTAPAEPSSTAPTDTPTEEEST